MNEVSVGARAESFDSFKPRKLRCFDALSFIMNLIRKIILAAMSCEGGRSERSEYRSES